MNARILRIELRRTIAPWTALLLLAVAIFTVYAIRGPILRLPAAFGQEWVSSALWTRMLLMYLLPIVIGAGALQGMRDSRSGTVELLGTTPRPAWHRAAKLAGLLAGLSFLAYAVIFGIGAAQVVARGGYFSFAWLPAFLIGGLAVVAVACIGLGAGRALPSPIIAPVLAVVTFVVEAALYLSFLNSTFGEGFLPNQVSLLAPAFADPQTVFATTATSVDIGQTLWFLGLAVTGFLLLVVKSVRVKVFALAPMALGALIAIPLFPASPADDLVFDRAAAELVCDGPVCVTRVHEDRLAGLVGPGRETLRLLAKLPGAPTKVVESSAPASFRDVMPRDPATVFVDLQSYVGQHTAPADLPRVLVGGAGVSSCFSVQRDEPREFAARVVAAAWFVGDLKPFHAGSYSDQRAAPIAEAAWRALRALPEPEQQTRILALRQALLTCHGDALDALVPGIAR
ncbi:hypothetical protein [Amycolatopsis sp. NPDC058986]|uniref:hypothetical protein n=1 Tax=unclassified Amycolatopsis TaxID=2618356 RepID=UPI00366FB115